MLKRFLSAAAAVLLPAAVWAGPAAAPAPAVPELESAIRWARESGVPQKIDARMAKALGLGDAAVPVIQKGFRLDREHTVFAVSAGTNQNAAPDVFILSDNSTNGVVWLTDISGVARATATYSTNDSLVRIPNADRAAEFDKVKTFFIGKAANYDEFKSAHGAPPHRRAPTNAPPIKPPRP